jgi:hypothetical protein
MAKIYFWDPDGKNVGHCSLRLDDGAYISFWPCQDYGPTQAIANITVPSACHTYENDKIDEGRDADRIIGIRGKMNNEKIHTWWMRNQECGYSVSNNCSTMVEKALEVGQLESNE